MASQPFFFTCPKCGAKRFVLPTPKRYHCRSCKAAIKVNSGGYSAVIEGLLLTPTFLLATWGVAEILVSTGVGRDMAQLLGICVSGLVNLPLYCAMHPMFSSVEIDQPSQKIIA